MATVSAFIDASVYTRSVCDHAAWAAQRLKGSLDLIHVLTRNSDSGLHSDFSGSMEAEGREHLLQELAELDEERAKLAMKRGRLILQDAKGLVSEAGGPAANTRLRHGDLVEAIADFEADAELLVIGKRGEAADFATLHLGSNLERVVRASHKPVLVAARAFKPISKALIAFDGGTSALKAVDMVSRSPLFEGVSIRLLMVAPESSRAQKKLESAADSLRGGGLTVETVLFQGHADQVITRQVEAEDIELLVMGAYGHSRIRSLIIGSTTS
ncbi:MAG: universal stress protein, partial [Rhodospirillaceae bacterium]